MTKILSKKPKGVYLVVNSGHAYLVIGNHVMGVRKEKDQRKVIFNEELRRKQSRMVDSNKEKIVRL